MSVVSAKMLQAAAGSAGGGGIPWDVSTAVFNGSPLNYSVLLSGNDIFISPDGLRAYALTTGNAYQYALSTAWDISTASYVQSYNFTAQETGGLAISFKPDGTSMYILGNGTDTIYEYTLSPAWDISTASYINNFLVGSQDSTPASLVFKPDGTKFYVCGATNSTIFEYNMSTAWNIATASYAGSNLSVSAKEVTPRGLFFKPDGTKMYVTGNISDAIHEYDLGTAWSVTSGSFLQSKDISAQNTYPRGVFFKPDGLMMYAIQSGGATYQFPLSTAWDVSTASWTAPSSGYLKITAQDANVRDVKFKPDGTKMYMLGASTDAVYEYTLSTPWEISTASYVQSFNVSAAEANPWGIFFSPDGQHMFFIGTSGDDVNRYDMSTPWDISTASFQSQESVSAYDTSPSSVFFKPDGTSMYVMGYSQDKVHEFSLSTAWLPSTKSHVFSFSITAQETAPYGMFFKDDGSKMYIVGAVGDAVFEYDLSTPWTISSASYSQSLYVNSLVPNPAGVAFKDDGSKLFLTTGTLGIILAYDL